MKEGQLSFRDYIAEKMKWEIKRGKEIPALVWLAKTIEVKPEELAAILDQVRAGGLYALRKKKKSDGTYRELHVPAKALRKIQRKISDHIFSDFQTASCVFGFSGGSIVDAITPHLGNKSILGIDIKDAFPSIGSLTIFDFLTQGRVETWGSLQDVNVRWRTPYFATIAELKPGYMSWYAARAVMELVTYRNTLPQGSPASPKIFDLILKPLDLRLIKLAEEFGATYTRYADNIFFSVKNEEFPKELRNDIIRQIQRKAGFQTHKFRIRTLNKEALRILGLNVIDDKIHNTRAFKARIRLTLHRLEWLLDHGCKDTSEFEETLRILRGQMNFARTDTLSPKLLNDYLELNKRLN